MDLHQGALLFLRGWIRSERARGACRPPRPPFSRFYPACLPVATTTARQFPAKELPGHSPCGPRSVPRIGDSNQKRELRRFGTAAGSTEASLRGRPVSGASAAAASCSTFSHMSLRTVDTWLRVNRRAHVDKLLFNVKQSQGCPQGPVGGRSGSIEPKWRGLLRLGAARGWGLGAACGWLVGK